jgi:hypothetical protein
VGQLAQWPNRPPPLPSDVVRRQSPRETEGPARRQGHAVARLTAANVHVLGQLSLRQLISTGSPLDRSMNALNKLQFLRMIWNANYSYSLAQPITVW